MSKSLKSLVFLSEGEFSLLEDLVEDLRQGDRTFEDLSSSESDLLEKLLSEIILWVEE